MKLGIKLTLRIFMVGTVSLLAMAGFDHYWGQQVVLQRALAALEESAHQRADQVEALLVSESLVTRTLAHAPALLGALEESNRHYDAMPPLERTEKIDELNRRWKATERDDDPFIRGYTDSHIARLLADHTRRNPEVYGEIFVTNRHGALVAATGRLSTLAHAHKYWWRAAYEEGRGRVFFDDRGFDTSVGGYVIGVVVPIFSARELVGIIKANVNLVGPLEDLVADHNEAHHGTMRIVRSKGKVVVEAGRQPLSTELDEPLSALLSERVEGSLDRVEAGRLFAYTPVQVTLGSEAFGFGGSFESIDHIFGNTGEAWMVVIELDRSAALEPLEARTILAIQIGGGVILVLGLLAAVVGRNISRPVTRLAAGAQRVGGGEFSVRVPVEGSDELATLASAFNGMAANLEETTVSRDRLAREIVAREAMGEELQRSNDELQRFAYVVSHDLQEPLRMVSSYLQLLSRRYTGKLDQDADEFIAFGVDGANRMSSMIEGLLEYSRVNTEGASLSDTDLEQVLDEALANLGLALEESGVELRRGALPTLPADAGQMQRLFQNLIGNALKFRAEESPRVSIEALRDGERWRISVSDNGIGIPADHAERIFTMFQRLHTREEYAGMGIGLAVCKRIVERHGGRIWVESVEGEGSRFYFTLPAAG